MYEQETTVQSICKNSLTLFELNIHGITLRFLYFPDIVPLTVWRPRPWFECEFVSAFLDAVEVIVVASESVRLRSSNGKSSGG